MPALHTKYRPTKFSEVVGHTELIKALQALIKRREQQAYLFASTIPGVGKTTLARIAAKSTGCASKDIMEIPAANFTGVDDNARGLTCNPAQALRRYQGTRGYSGRMRSPIGASMGQPTQGRRNRQDVF
jgi:23S rRNA A2030 N6-methylase RlmJ